MPSQSDFYFQTFSFTSDFTDLLSVSWTQPAFGTSDPDAAGLILGLHQFDDITTRAVDTVPEPMTLSLAALGTAMVALHARRSRSSRRRSG